MGRTLLPFRPAFEKEMESWKEFRRGLNKEEQPIFDVLSKFAREHADAGSLAARPLLSEILFFSIAIEQQKLIQKLNSKLKSLEEKIVK